LKDVEDDKFKKFEESISNLRLSVEEKLPQIFAEI